MRFLVTGSAGFIGFHLCRRLLAEGHTVVGFDAMTEYYDLSLKEARHALLAGSSNRFTPVIARLEDMAALEAAAELAQPDVIVHLAAQAGVRYSLENPRAYVDSNLVGSFNLLEIARVMKPRHMLLASTSSVYGESGTTFSEHDRADFPITLYAATKKAMEVMAHSYSHLWDLPITCLRFFTVYGPWGRPDMALFKFVQAMEEDRPIDIYGMGEMKRDFTYVDDVVEGIVRLIDLVPVKGQPVSRDGVVDTLSAVAPWRCVNVGGGTPVGLLEFVEAVEAAVGRPAQRNLLPMQPGDVRETFCDHRLLEALTGFRPGTPVRAGVRKFVEWYLDRH